MQIFKASEITDYLKLCLPLMAAFLAQKGMQFIDTLMMGWLGPEALAAGALAAGIYFIILVFCRGIISALGVAIAHARGSAQVGQINIVLQQGYYFALLLSLPSMSLAWFAPYGLAYAGQNPIVVADTVLLLHGLVWGIPGFLLFFMLREYISVFALAKAVMIVSLISIPITFAGNYILIYGKYGFPVLGIEGIGYTGSIVGWFMFGCLLWYCQSTAVLKQNFSTWTLKVNLTEMKNLLFTGSFSGITTVLDPITFFIASIMFGYFGVISLASYQIVMQCLSIAYNLPLAVSIITGLKVSHSLGANHWAQLKRDIHVALFIGVVISLGFTSLFLLKPKMIIELFLPDNIHAISLYQATSLSLLAGSVILFFDAAQVILIGALRGVKDTFMPMIGSFCCYLLIGLGCSYLLAFHTYLSSLGIWIGLTLAMISLSLFLALRLANIFSYQKKTECLVQIDASENYGNIICPKVDDRF